MADRRYQCLFDTLPVEATNINTSRIDCAVKRLRELNPRLEIVSLPENVNDTNAAELVAESLEVADSGGGSDA